ncbi:hypothetical protein [Chitinophaga filiformis]|uniref:Uncharacterized protein n=1 Tax=Chitinophaga filiformis TaxID=104663 RepID=A0ABY4I1C8_CHIFI|nr:hypothetical protein [Chitinophaga filiformis]UPK69433.1 hypothetical protein MYF79_31205 [Chitinophaga filiformis]
MIEFSFKYILFSSLRVKETQNLYEYDDEIFRKSWQQHNFDRLRLVLDTKRIIISTDVPYIGIKVENKELDDLIKAWDVQIRYSLGLSHQPVVLTEPLMEEFVGLTEQILKRVTSKY